jgi:hypothetical protein
MATMEHEIDIPTGRNGLDGRVKVYVFSDELLALTVDGLSERAPTLLLTLEQARRLKEALDELIPTEGETLQRAEDKRAA